MACIASEFDISMIAYRNCKSSIGAETYRYACIVYKTTAADWQLHLYNPSRATAKRITVKTPNAAANRWLITEPFELTKYDNHLMNRLNNGIHGTFAFTSDDSDAVFYIKTVTFFASPEQASRVTYDRDGIPTFISPSVTVSLSSKQLMRKNATLHYHTAAPYKTGEWCFDEKTQALAVKYSKEEYLLGEYNVGHFRFAPEFLSPNMLYIAAAHTHPYSKIYVLTGGKANMECGCETFTLRRGGMVFIPANTHHCLRSIGEEPTEWTELGVEYAKSDELSPAVTALTEDEQDIFRVLCHDIEKYCTFDNETAITPSVTAKQLFSVFWNYIEARAERQRREEKEAAVFNAAVSYMKSNIGRQLTVAEIMNACAVCRTRLKYIFSRYAYIGCIEYFNRLKLEHARKMLLDGKSCAAVSEALGFSSQAYFSRRFKQEYGISPSSVNRT